MKPLLLVLLTFVFIKATAQSNNIAPLATVSTSYVSPWETLASVNDEHTPANSGDRDHGVYGNLQAPILSSGYSMAGR